MSWLALVVILNAIPVTWSQAGFEDLAFLRSELRGKKIVQLGEATHGGAEFYRLKTKLVRFLHERMDFQVLAIETGALEAGLAFAHRERLSARELLEATLFGSYRYAEMLPLMEYVKSKPGLRVIGIDPQFASDEVLALAKGLLAPYGAKWASEVEKRLGDGHGLPALVNQPDEFRTKRDAYLRWLGRLAKHVDTIRPTPADGEAVELLRRSIGHLRRYYDFEPTSPATDRMILREELMSCHLAEQTKGQKVILWAHNGHIGRGLGFKVLGDHLRERYGKDTYALGLFAKAGNWTQFWTGSSEKWAAPPDGLESRFPSDGEAWFRPAKDFPEPTSAFEPENGGVLRFEPSQRFDGIVVLTRVSAATRP